MQDREVPLQVSKEKVRHLPATELTGEFGMHSLRITCPGSQQRPRALPKQQENQFADLSRCQTLNKTYRAFTLEMPNAF